MSLVERALKKLRESRQATDAAQPGLDPARAGALIDPALPRRPGDPHAPAPASDYVRDDPPATPIEIDREALRNMGLLPPVEREREISSQYQQIKRALVASVTGSSGAAVKNAHTIMIASALPGEGKTYVSINLALSLAAEKDFEVLLVDGDAPKPHISRIFSLSDRPGLLDLLVDRHRSVASVVVPTNIPRFSILPAGGQNDTTTELFASDRMHAVVASLAQPAGRRIVVFDSPPMLLATEAHALMSAIGQIVLVVRSEITPRQAVFDALEAIGDSRPVSLILNQVSTRGSPGYYNYGYSYGEPAVGE